MFSILYGITLLYSMFKAVRFSMPPKDLMLYFIILNLGNMMLSVLIFTFTKEKALLLIMIILPLMNIISSISFENDNDEILP